MISDFLRLLRVKQWVKNAFIFFPIIFAGLLHNPKIFTHVTIVFFAFCFISSATYILNDFMDKDKDKQHPIKSRRPLASGKIPLYVALTFMFLLLTIGLTTLKCIDESILFVGILYLFLNLIYNFLTKKIVILDVISIAIGFQLRIWAGSLACQVLPSIWLQFCVLLLSLFLGFIKRRHELSILEKSAALHRPVLQNYTAYLLDQLTSISATLTIVFYGLYSISPEVQMRLGYSIIYSLIFVIYGLFRYLYLVQVKNLGGEPGDVILKDLPSMINLVLWIFFIFGNLYVYKP